MYMEKYYKAYDKRYKQIHKQGLSWAINNNTKIVDEIIIKYKLEKCKMLEIGCGEGRDSKYLLNKGYNLLATDVSKEAIKYCIDNDPIHKNNYKVLDVLKDSLNEKYDFIFSVACIHMLVLDEDRKNYYKFTYNHLNDHGYSLILSMGDGSFESKSDITTAFNNVKRIHQETDKEVSIAATSCRIVNFDTLKKEVINNNFKTHTL